MGLNLDKYKNKFAGTTETGLDSNKPTFGSDNRSNYLRKDITIFKPELDKVSRIRIFPGLERDVFYKQVGVHFDVGPDHSSVVCPSEFREFCPLCERNRTLFAEGQKKKKKEFRAATYFLMWVIDRNNEDKGPQVFPATRKVLDGILKLTKSRETGEFRAIDDLEAGRDVLFEKSKNGGSDFPNFAGFELGETARPITADQEKAEVWLDFILDNGFDKILSYKSPNDIEEMAFGDVGKTVDAKDDDRSEPEPPPPPKSSTSDQPTQTNQDGSSQNTTDQSTSTAQTAEVKEASAPSAVTAPAVTAQASATTTPPAASGGGIDAIRARLAARQQG